MRRAGKASGRVLSPGRLRGRGLIAALLVMACLGVLWNGPAQARPRSLQELAAIMGKVVETGVKYGSIPSLYRPRYDLVQDANLSLSDDEVVFVVMAMGSPS